MYINTHIYILVYTYGIRLYDGRHYYCVLCTACVHHSVVVYIIHDTYIILAMYMCNTIIEITNKSSLLKSTQIFGGHVVHTSSICIVSIASVCTQYTIDTTTSLLVAISYLCIATILL
jgi:hypothetical protein